MYGGTFSSLKINANGSETWLFGSGSVKIPIKNSLESENSNYSRMIMISKIIFAIATTLACLIEKKRKGMIPIGRSPYSPALIPIAQPARRVPGKPARS